MQLFMTITVVCVCLFLTVWIGIFCYREHWAKGRICRRCGVRIGDGMKTRSIGAAKEPMNGGSVRRLVRRLRCTLLGHVVYPCDHSGSSLLRRTEEGVEADCYHCGKTIKATCGLELCGLVWRRKPNEKSAGTGVSGKTL